MDRKNLDIVGKALNDILRNSLVPYIARELESQYMELWWSEGVLAKLYESSKRNLPARGSYAELTDSMDVQMCLILMDIHWDKIFSKKLSINHRNWLKETNTIRNQWAHQKPKEFDDSSTVRALDTMARLCEQIDNEGTMEIRNLLREVAYGDAAGSMAGAGKPVDIPMREQKKGNVGILQSMTGNLKSWREVMQPHPDVAEGRYQQAEFAADLAQVARGEGSMEYLDPIEFFARTYVTEGMSGLLVQALHRVHGDGGEPVIQLKTSFGGGKTHSMLAIYHLFHGQVRPEQSPNAKKVLQKAEMDMLPVNVRVAVVVGTALNPAKAKRPINMPGITINTLWGEIGAQLAFAAGNPKLYDYVKEADKKGVSPGSEALRDLFDACGSCVILVDELVAYAKKIYGNDGLPAGSFDNLISFIQELTEAARASKSSMVVASLPESEIEVGGTAGQVVLAQIEHTFGRMESIWKPVAANESFEVVRRRLFSPCKDEEARDMICTAFSELYRSNDSEFPVEAKDMDYKNRMLACYPIHPEFFNYLYNEWATIDNFQKTRGVLRLMAGVVYHLWIHADASCMIMPGSLPIELPQIRDELIRYLPENWNAIVDSEIDGKDSEAFKIDQGNPRFGAYMAARRVARTIFLGSAPSVREQKIRGIEESHIRLGVIQPNENNAIPIFNDALSKLKGQLTYLYTNENGSRFWFDNRPTLRKLVQDQEQQIPAGDIDHEIEQRLQGWKKSSAFPGGVHICPKSSLDVLDEQTVRLVILPLDAVHERNQKDTSAIEAAESILEMRGNSPRRYKNMLVFLAPDKTKLFELRKIIRRYKAWKIVRDEAERRNLDQAQIREADNSIKQIQMQISMHLSQAYSWVLAPFIEAETDIKKIQWDVAEVSCTNEDNIRKAAERLNVEENLISEWGAPLLLMELDNLLWKNAEHIEVKQLWEYLTAYCYLPRLAGFEVLARTITAAVATDEYFGLADGFSDGRYVALRFNEPVTGTILSHQLLVKKSAVKKQREEEQRQEAERRNAAAASVQPVSSAGYSTAEEESENPEAAHETSETTLPTPPIEYPQPQNKHFSMDVTLDNVRVNKDVNNYMTEIIAHLMNLPGADVQLRLEVDVQVPDGTPADVVRTVTENCRTLKVEGFRFEE